MVLLCEQIPEELEVNSPQWGNVEVLEPGRGSASLVGSEKLPVSEPRGSPQQSHVLCSTISRLYTHTHTVLQKAVLYKH